MILFPNFAHPPVSSSGLSRGSNSPLSVEFVAPWILGTRPRMMTAVQKLIVTRFGR